MLEEAGTERLTLSFYQYAHIGNPQLFRDHLFLTWNALEVLGRIYVAHEGINAQVSVPTENIEAFRAFLYFFEPMNGIRLNIAVDDDGKSFTLKWSPGSLIQRSFTDDTLSDGDTFECRYVGTVQYYFCFNINKGGVSCMQVSLTNNDAFCETIYFVRSLLDRTG